MAFTRGLDITTRELVRCFDPGNTKSYPGSTSSKIVNLINRLEVDISGDNNWQYDTIDSRGVLRLSPDSSIYSNDIEQFWTNRSIQFWIKRMSNFSAPFATFKYLFGCSSYSSIDNRISISLNNTIVRKEFNIGIDYTLNEWTNICWIFEAANTDFGIDDIKIYVNGVNYPITQTVVNTNFVASQVAPFRLNSYLGAQEANIDAKYGHLLEYDTILTEEEVIRNYNATKHRYMNREYIIDNTLRYFFLADNDSNTIGNYVNLIEGFSSMTMSNIETYDSDFNYYGFSQSMQSTGIVSEPSGIDGELTVCVWSRFKTTNGGYSVAEYDYYGGNKIKRKWVLGMSGGQLRGIVYSGNNVGDYKEVYGSALNTNEWYFLTLVFTPTQSLSVYLNGVLDNTNTDIPYTGTNVHPDNYIRMGHTINSTSTAYFDVDVGSFLMYSRALSDEEILENYNAEKGKYSF